MNTAINGTLEQKQEITKQKPVSCTRLHLQSTNFKCSIISTAYSNRQSLIGQTVYKHFSGHGLCKYTVKSFNSDEDVHIEWPWCIA